MLISIVCLSIFVLFEPMSAKGAPPTGSTGGAIKSGALSGMSSIAGKLADAGVYIAVIYAVLYILFQVFGWFLKLAYQLLNTAFMLATQPEWYNSDAVRLGWKIFRDFANFWIILILLFIAISIMLRIQSVGSKKTLTTLIVVALLINFSMMITQMIIDATNIITYEFAQKMGPSISGPDGRTTNDVASTLEFGLNTKATMLDIDAQHSTAGKVSGAYTTANDLSLSRYDEDYRYPIYSRLSDSNSAVGVENAKALNLGVTACVAGPVACFLGIVTGYIVEIAFVAAVGWVLSALSFGGVVIGPIISLAINDIILAIAIYIILTFAITLLIRAVVLMFLVVLSPAAFLFAILPSTQAFAREWWTTLLKQAFFAPAMAFLLYVSLIFMSQFQVLLRGESLSFVDLKNGRMIVFILSIGMLIATLKMGQKMGAYGADSAMKFFKIGQGYLTGAIIGGAINQTIGRAGQAIKTAAPESYLANRVGTKMMDAGKMSPFGSRAQQTEAKATFQLASTLKKSMPDQLKDLRESKNSEFRNKLADAIMKDDKTLSRAIKTGDVDGLKVLRQIVEAQKGVENTKKFDKAVKTNELIDAKAANKTMAQFLDEKSARMLASGKTPAEVADEQEKYFKAMSAQEQSGVTADWQGDTTKVAMAQKWVGKFDPEDQIKYNDSVGKALVRDLDKLAPNFDRLPEDLKKIVGVALSDNDIQVMAGKVPNQTAFYESVEKYQPNKITILDSSLPDVAMNKGKSAKTVVPTINFKTVSKNAVAPRMDSVMLNANVRQMNTILERPDLAEDYLKKIELRYQSVGGDIEKLAQEFQDQKNMSMANFIRTQKPEKVKKILRLT